MILTVSGDYLFKQHQPADLRNSDGLRFLRGTG